MSFEDTVRAMLVGLLGAILAGVGAVARYMSKTVSRAAVIVQTGEAQAATILALRDTVAAKDICIEALERRVDDLERELGEAQRRIGQMERTMRELRKEKA